MQPLRGLRHGLTLIELMVALAIIALLLALLLPAVTASRSSARRVQCGNNLRQIGLALQNYHGTHGVFAPGYSPRAMSEDEYLVSGRQLWDQRPAYSWSVHILPQLGQPTLYDQFDVNGPMPEEVYANPAKVHLAMTPLSVFLCPADIAGPTVATAPIEDKWKTLLRFVDVSKGAGATSCYVGNCGYFPPYHPSSPTPGTRLEAKGVDDGPNNGIFYMASAVRYADVTDGASQTIAVGERAWFQGSSTWVGSSNPRNEQAGGAPMCLGRVYWRINELPDPPGVLITPENGLIIDGKHSARDGFGSYHVGGANFVMCDGSVRFISDTIDSLSTSPASQVSPLYGIPDVSLIGVFQRLGVRNDGTVVGEF